MSKVLVEFDNIEQAVSALSAVGLTSIRLDGPVAPQQSYAAPAPQAYAPTPQVAQAPAFAPAPQAYAPPVAPAPAPQAPVPVAGSGITQAQVAGAAQAYAKVHGAPGAKAKLAEFGITKVSEANPAQYPALMQALAV